MKAFQKRQKKRKFDMTMNEKTVFDKNWDRSTSKSDLA